MPKGFSESYFSDGPSYSDPRLRGRGRTRVRSSSFDPPGYKHQGFTRGFSLGEETGWREGYNLGLQRGAQIASELGFYQGYVHAWLTVLEREETVKQRKLSALRTLLDMTKSFPRASLYDEDIMDKLLKIRAQFKQNFSSPGDPENIDNEGVDGIVRKYESQRICFLWAKI